MVKGRHLVKVFSDNLFDCLDMVVVIVVVLWVVISKTNCPAFHRKSFLVVRGMEFIAVAVSKVKCLLFLVVIQST